MQLVKMAKKSKKDVNCDEHKRDTVKWTQEMDDVLIDTLLEQQVNGNRPDGTFTSTAYVNVVQICIEKIGYPFDKDHVKNRMKTLKANFNICFDLLKSTSGFAWSPETKLFEADQKVWDTLIQVYP